MGAVDSLHAGSHLLVFRSIHVNSITHDTWSDKWSGNLQCKAVCQTYLGQQITVLLLQASNLALSLLLVVGHLQDQLLQRLILCLTQDKQSLNQSLTHSIIHSFNQPFNPSINHIFCLEVWNTASKSSNHQAQVCGQCRQC